jgi:hypothetical protein
MSSRKRDLWYYITMIVVSAAALAVAAFDPADRPTHLRAYIYVLLLLLTVAGLIAKLRGKN